MEIDLYIGRLVAIFVSGGGFLSGLSKKDLLRVSWEQIEKIGDDVILIRLSRAEAEACRCYTEKKECKPP